MNKKSQFLQEIDQIIENDPTLKFFAKNKDMDYFNNRNVELLIAANKIAFSIWVNNNYYNYGKTRV